VGSREKQKAEEVTGSRERHSGKRKSSRTQREAAQKEAEGSIGTSSLLQGNTVHGSTGKQKWTQMKTEEVVLSRLEVGSRIKVKRRAYILKE
jgi:hypothetical protein